MKTATFMAPGKIELKEYQHPKIKNSTDAIIRVIRTCVCGSDLWWYRGINKRNYNTPVGHEAIGIVESVGDSVNKIKIGDFVIAPFTHGCGHCVSCLAGFDGNCLNNNVNDNEVIGYQSEYFRFKNANWALVKIPGKPQDYEDAQLNDFLALSDVMATGFHAAKSAEVKQNDTVVVIGDGAVGLCGVLSARLLKAKRIIAMSRHHDRQKLAQEFGATDIVPERGEDGINKVKKLTGYGADAVLECVGTAQSIDTAIKIGRPGAIVGRVGVPQKDILPGNNLFWQNLGIRGGIASVTTYDREILLNAVLKGIIHPGKVFTKKFSLNQIQQAYEAMDRREAIKSLVVVK
ncbi:MAG: zinc-dependent alcohol dehydrogenase family protein [Lactobacillaceae bacterium]